MPCGSKVETFGKQRTDTDFYTAHSTLPTVRFQQHVLPEKLLLACRFSGSLECMLRKSSWTPVQRQEKSG